jgi:hypothetical protein
VDALLQDLRFALRSLRKSPAFALVAVLCLAFGIATNVTLFSVFDAIIVRPLPFEEPERIVTLRERDPRNNDNWMPAAYLSFLDWKAQGKTIGTMAASSGRSVTITEGEEPERLVGELVSWNMFPMLGIRPQLGRTFREDENQPGAPGTVILSDALWRWRYAADSSIINRVISINSQPHTVIGVMPVGFKFPRTRRSGSHWRR